jgi:hypothetical protein
MATLVTILWRDVPLQVVAREGRETRRAILPGRFQEAADRAAMRAGKQTAGAYVGEMRRESRDCGPDLEREASAEAARIEAAYTEDMLAHLVAAGGIDPGREAGA